MKSLCKRIVALFLIALFLIPLAATPVFATGRDVVVVQSEKELFDAIEAVPQGGEGKILVKDVFMFLSQGIYFENKTLTLYLENAQLVTQQDEYGYGSPVLLALDADVTIIADERSSMHAQVHTGGMGVVRVDNGDWDMENNCYRTTCHLNIIGGSFSCAEDDIVFPVSAGTDAVIENAVCDGPVESILGVGLDWGGNITVKSGRFTNDVKEFVQPGKYYCQVGDKYYVRDTEYTPDFLALLQDGKLVFDQVKPTEVGEELFLLAEDVNRKNPNVYFNPESFSDDFTRCELGLYFNTAKEEIHTVDVVWNYDPKVNEAAQSFIEKFPDPEGERPWFDVSDLELVNYWLYHDPDSEEDSLANYSGQLKSYLNNTNFLFNIENRAGGDEPFYTERMGSAKLVHDGKVYFSTMMIGARAEHVIYVPENTESTKEALLLAAQKRIDDYVGPGKVTLTPASTTVTEYYNEQIADFDRQITSTLATLASVQASLDAELAKDPAIQNSGLISSLQMQIMNVQWTLDWANDAKQYFIQSWQEGGDMHFLTRAAGDFIFDLVIGEERRQVVIIKDDTRLVTPSYASVDLDTKVSVKTTSSSLPLDTTVQVKKITQGTDFDLVKKSVAAEQMEVFDIGLHSVSLGKSIKKLPDGMFSVTLPMPEGFDGKKLAVYYVDPANESAEPVRHDVKVSEDRKFVTFQTDHFSIYTLAVETATPSAPGQTAPSSPATGDASTLALWMGAYLLSLSCLVAILWQKKKETR